ncbi:hypothetical protein X739_08700 [Mesorhizobium sp. LNHC220B00]|nr:hypothetical protein X739_08700 [Mesorhizobium sp. LNHC220B00]
MQNAPSPGQDLQLNVLLILLLGAYCVPIFAVTVSSGWQIWDSTNGKIGAHTVEFLLAVASDQSRYAGSIKNLLLPVATAITAANYKSVNFIRWGLFLFLIPLTGVFACVANALMFDVAVEAIGEEARKSVALISSMFLETATTLSGYVMMLVGLKATK